MLAPSSLFDSPRVHLSVKTKSPPTRSNMEITDLLTALSMGLPGIKLTLPRLLPKHSPGYEAQRSFGFNIVKEDDSGFGTITALNPNVELAMVEQTKMVPLRKLPPGHTIIQVNGDFILGSSIQELKEIVKAHAEEEDALELILAHPDDVVNLLASRPSRFDDAENAEEEAYEAAQMQKDTADDFGTQYMTMPDYDWRVVGKSESYIRQVTPDTTPLSDVAKKPNFRDLDVLAFSDDWHKGTHVEREKTPLDTDAHSMAIANHDHRHFIGPTRLHNDAQTTTLEIIRPDPIPVGNTAGYHTKDLDGNTRMYNDHSRSTLNETEADVIPTGNTALYHSHEFVGNTRMFNDTTSELSSITSDAIPSGNTALYKSRDISGQSHMFNDAQHSSLNHISPDATGSLGNALVQSSRDFEHFPSHSDWKASASNKYDEVAPDASASINRPSVFTGTDYNFKNAHGEKWDYTNNNTTTQPDQFALNPEASTGSNAIDVPREVMSGGMDMSAPTQSPEDVYDHAASVKPMNPRDLGAVSPTLAWKSGQTSITKPLGYDTDSTSAGAHALRNPRDLNGENQWSNGGPIARTDLVDTDPSAGNPATNHTRDYVQVHQHLEWHRGGVTSTAHTTKLDTTASEGSTALRPPRVLEDDSNSSQWDGSRPGDTRDAIDSEPSNGYAQANNAREFVAMGQEWKIGIQSTVERIGADDSGSLGSTAMTHPRDFVRPKRGDWNPNNVGADAKVVVNSEPSSGNALVHSSRDFNQVGAGFEWRGGKSSNDDAAFADGSAAVEPALYPRDNANIDSMRDWKINATDAPYKQIAGDGSASVDVNYSKSAFRAFESRGSDDWKSSGRYPGDLAYFDTLPTAQSVAMYNHRELDTNNGAWMGGGGSGGLAKLKEFTEGSTGNALTQHARDFEPVHADLAWRGGVRPEAVKPVADDAVDVVAASAYPQFRPYGDNSDWRFSLSRRMSALSLASEAVDVVVANAYPDFRQDTEDSTDDMNRSFVGGKAEMPKSLGTLDHDVYVDPSKREVLMHNRGAPDPNKRHGGSLRFPPKMGVKHPHKRTEHRRSPPGRSAPVNTLRNKAASSAKRGVRPGGGVSSNMAAFLAGEELRRKRAYRRETSPQQQQQHHQREQQHEQEQKPTHLTRPSTSHGNEPTEATTSPTTLKPHRRRSDPTTLSSYASRPYFHDCRIPQPSPQLMSSPRRAHPNSASTRIPLRSGGAKEPQVSHSCLSRVALNFENEKDIEEDDDEEEPVEDDDDDEEEPHDDDDDDDNNDDDDDGNAAPEVEDVPEKLTILPLTDEHTTIDISPKKDGGMEISRTSMIGVVSNSTSGTTDTHIHNDNHNNNNNDDTDTNSTNTNNDNNNNGVSSDNNENTIYESHQNGRSPTRHKSVGGGSGGDLMHPQNPPALKTRFSAHFDPEALAQLKKGDEKTFMSEV